MSLIKVITTQMEGASCWTMGKRWVIRAQQPLLIETTGRMLKTPKVYINQCRRCWEHQTRNLSFPRHESFSQEWKNFKGTKTLCLGEAQKCVLLVFQITTASKRTACHSFPLCTFSLLLSAHVDTEHVHIASAGRCWSGNTLLHHRSPQNLLLQPGKSC